MPASVRRDAPLAGSHLSFNVPTTWRSSGIRLHRRCGVADTRRNPPVAEATGHTPMTILEFNKRAVQPAHDEHPQLLPGALGQVRPAAPRVVVRHLGGKVRHEMMSRIVGLARLRADSAALMRFQDSTLTPIPDAAEGAGETGQFHNGADTPDAPIRQDASGENSMSGRQMARAREREREAKCSPRPPMGVRS